MAFLLLTIVDRSVYWRPVVDRTVYSNVPGSVFMSPVSVAAQKAPTAAVFLLASITVAFMAGASAPMPLYPTYQAEWGFSSLTITVIFGVYALAVLAALLVFGRLSDHVGRRPVLFASIAVQVFTMWLFAHADGLATLL